jgi:hypothetical protein
MPRDIEDEIADNRRAIGRAFAADRRASSSASTGLLLSPTPVDVEATLEVYTRSVGKSAIAGHPATGQGWGRGSVGDHRGSWTKQESTTVTLDREGRQALADALIDQSVALEETTVGANPTLAFGVNEGLATTRARSSWRFDKTPETVSTGELQATDNRVLASGSFTTPVSQDQEVRLDVSLTFTAAPQSDREAVTDVATVAESIRTTDSVELIEIALGTDGTNPDSTDTALGNEVIRKSTTRSRSGTAAILQTSVFRNEPGTQPHDIREFALVDQDGDIVTRVVFAVQSKDDRIRLRARSGIRFE